MAINNFDTTNEVSVQELHKLFIKYKQHASGTAPATIKKYIQTFRLLLLFKPDISLPDITETTIINFMEFLNTRPRKVGKKLVVRTYKNSSMASVRGGLNAFFKWLFERKYIPANPFHTIPYPDVAYTDRRAFTLRELEVICFAIQNRIKWQSLLIKKRNVAILMFLVYTGVRKEELLGLNIDDLDMERRLVMVRAETSKSKRSRVIPYNEELTCYLEDYLHARKDLLTRKLWVSGTHDSGLSEHGLKHLTKYLTKVTKINCYVHRGRHTFATNYYNMSHDIVGLSKVMGHTSLKMTFTYLRSLPDDHVATQMNSYSIGKFI